MRSIRSNVDSGAARRRATVISLALFAVVTLRCPAVARPHATETATPALASPSATPLGSPVSSSVTAVDPTITARAKEWLHRMQTADVDRSQLNARMNAVLTDQKIAQVAAQLAPLGEPAHFTFLRKLESNAGTAYIYGATFKAHPAMWVFALDPTRKINGLIIRPLDAASPAPASARPAKALP